MYLMKSTMKVLDGFNCSNFFGASANILSLVHGFRKKGGIMIIIIEMQMSTKAILLVTD